MDNQIVPVAVSNSLNNTHQSEYLNAFQVVNAELLSWDVRIYSIRPNSSAIPKHQERGKIKGLVWELRKLHSSMCKGYGFVIDIGKDKVAIPATWEIPDQDDFDGFQVRHEQTLTAYANDPAHRAITLGILRESIKIHFKNQAKYPSNEEIGVLWQNYGNFCQLPADALHDDEVDYCRQFNVSSKELSGNTLALQFAITTTSVDTRTFSDYYLAGEVAQLAEMLRIKQGTRLNRSNEPVSIRVLCVGRTEVTVMDLERPEDVFDHEHLPLVDQQMLAKKTIRCKPFKKPVMNVPFSNLRLILDSKITGGNHSNTIIDPDDRAKWFSILRNFFNGLECYGCSLALAENPITIDAFDTLEILPPAIAVRNSKGNVQIMPAPKVFTRHALDKRRKDREKAIFKNGFLEKRPVNLLLTAHKRFGNERLKRMQSDLNWLLKLQGISYRFDTVSLFENVPQISRTVQRGEHDALFVVLPESRQEPYTNTDTHEKVKRSIQIPSQCIHYDNTLPSYWANKSVREFKQAKPRLARRIERHYRQCLLGLFVKHNWIPFIPSDSFNYNVQIGIDVGGQHNTEVMVCIGYGFANPGKNGLTFLLKHIKVDSQQAEPILVEPLYAGLLDLFDELKALLDEADVSADFRHVLFFRDGAFLGKGDEWNELDAIHMLYNTIRNERNWFGDDALWTGIELSKRAEYWRIFRQENRAVWNPLVGRCVFPFDDPYRAIICTTGSPYLTQGTASPLLVQIINIVGSADREKTLRDLIWSADMCYTKLDTGMSFPWVLNVADSGALQTSKAYKVTGITV